MTASTRDRDAPGRNGDEAEEQHGDSSLEFVREHPANPYLLRGIAPFVVGVVLFLLMLVLAPTVAPEQVVEKPVNSTTTTSPVEP
jgi:hypothetical protein